MPAHNLENEFTEPLEYKPKKSGDQGSGNYSEYEKGKRELQKMNLSCTDYQYAIQVLAEELNLWKQN